ncbi:MAG: OmpA family protein [Deltaproteobacteria bacterium]|nr:OmpA family protein [Deltaproteobacteria bacterium]
MSRKKVKHPEHVNLERWLVSYADFITLLFAFFVVMFAISNVDSNKVGRFTESVRAATRWGMFEKSGTPGAIEGRAAAQAQTGGNPGNGGRRSGTQSMAALRAKMEAGLRGAIEAGRVSLVESEEGLVIRLRDTAFFASGSADLHEEATGDLATIGASIKDLPNDLRIEGHTDSRPIHTPRFRSNWDLSAARAATVLDVLAQEAGIPESRLSVAGYADRRPVASNDTDDGRRKNRRVDLVLVQEAPPPERRAPGPTDRWLESPSVP